MQKPVNLCFKLIDWFLSDCVTDTKMRFYLFGIFLFPICWKIEIEYLMYRGIFRTQSNIYGGPKSRKLFSKISSIVDVQLGSEHASDVMI